MESRLKDIRDLKSSINYNRNEEKALLEELESLSKEQTEVLERVKNLTDRGEKKKLEKMVQKELAVIQYNEMSYNLKLQEKMNALLVKEIKRIKNICTKNNFPIDEEEEENSSEEERNQRFVKKMGERRVPSQQKESKPNPKRIQS